MWPLNLFDPGPRSQSESVRPTESYFEFLNRVAGDFWQDVRNELERWYAGLPASSHEGIHARMRGDEAGFWSAFWELFLHQMFVELGWRVEFAPDGEGGISPDLYIADSHEEYLVEATVLMEPESDARSELRRGPLMEGLSQVHTRDFWLGLQIDSEGESQPSGSRLAREIQGWVDGLTYTLPPDQTTGEEQQAIPEKAFADRGWHIRIRALPKSQGHRRTTSGMQLGPVRGRFVDDHLAMTEDLKKKAQRYRSSQIPLVLTGYEPVAVSIGSRACSTQARRYTDSARLKASTICCGLPATKPPPTIHHGSRSKSRPTQLTAWPRQGRCASGYA